MQADDNLNELYQQTRYKKATYTQNFVQNSINCEKVRHNFPFLRRKRSGSTSNLHHKVG